MSCGLPKMDGLQNNWLIFVMLMDGRALRAIPFVFVKNETLANYV